MQPIRRLYEHRPWWVRRLFQLMHSNPSFWFILILWVITGYKSLIAYQNLAQELRPDNPLCSSSRTCLHIQIPLHLALLGHILSLYMLYEIITMIFWPVDAVGEDILMSAVVLKDWYRWTSLMITIPSFVVLVFMEQYDNAVPWISGLYTAFRAGLLVAYFILMLNWWTTIVSKEKDEQPGQELNWCLHNRGARIEPSKPTDLGSKSDESDKKPNGSGKKRDEADKGKEEVDEEIHGADKTPKEADEKPDEFVKKPEEADEKPEEADKKPAESEKKPGEFVKKPEEADKKPDESKKKRDESEKKPDETHSD